MIQSDDIEHNSYFRILGNVGNSVAVMLSTDRMLLQSRSSLTRPSTLVSLADYHWWLSATNRDSLSSGVCQQVASRLIREADRIGQINRNQFIGRGCFRHDGQTAWHLGDQLLVGGKTVKLSAIPGVAPIAGPRITLSPNVATEDERRRIARAVLRYRWKLPKHGRRFLGWIVAAAIGGALDWRVHIRLSGTAESGKSWLIESVLRPLLRGLLIYVGDTSAAGLARAVGSDSGIVAFDQAETSSQLDAVLDLAGLASGGGRRRVRADVSTASGSHVCQPRFSLLFVGHDAAHDMRERRRGRGTMASSDPGFVSVRLSTTGVPDWLSVRDDILTALERPERLFAAIVQDAPAIIDRVHDRKRVLVDGGVSPRRAAIEAAIGAGWEWWSGEEDRVLEDDAEDQESTTDAVDLLRFLLRLQLQLHEGPEDLSVARLLRAGDTKQIARGYGFQIRNGVLQVALRHPALVDLLARGKWSGVDQQRILLQVAGVTKGKNPISFGDVKTRATCVPRAVCERLGIDIFRAPDAAGRPVSRR